MEASGISTGTNLAAIVQSAKTDASAAPQQPETAEQSYLSKLDRLGADHPLTKFLGGFWSQHVDTYA
ncbi:MAG: hypothetical protein H6508_01820 [Calditrichaeota bacterium]|nr:hypothetical protein [Calditrichota bacterium]